MPDRGTLGVEQIAAWQLNGQYPAPWTTAQARWCQVTFEVEQQAALRHLPGDVGRPVPCYARLFILDAADGPAGPFKLATLMVGGRYRMLPRNVPAAGVVDGPFEAVAGAFGAPYSEGSITLAQADGEAIATVSTGGEILASVRLPALRAIDPTMLRWDLWLGFAGPGDNIDLIEYGPQPEARQAFLSKQATLETSTGLPRDSTWRQLRNINTISACYAEGAITLTAPEIREALT
jgi:hypothetical protein